MIDRRDCPQLYSTEVYCGLNIMNLLDPFIMTEHCMRERVLDEHRRSSWPEPQEAITPFSPGGLKDEGQPPGRS